MKVLLGLTLLATLSGHHFMSDGDHAPNVTSIFRVAIDPGHGGIDEGMSFNGAVEKDITLAIAKEIAKTKFDHTTMLLLRTDDSDVSFKNRIKSSKSIDLYISLHINFNEAQGAGPSVYYSVKGKDPKSSKGYGNFFASRLMKEQSKAKEATSELIVLDHLKCPSIHLEVGNLGALSDFASLTGEEGQIQIAQEIALVIQELADLKYENGLVVNMNSLKPKMDSLFFKNIQKAKGN